jgi:hypothetical protein
MGNVFYVYTIAETLELNTELAWVEWACHTHINVYMPVLFAVTFRELFQDSIVFAPKRGCVCVCPCTFVLLSTDACEP